MTTEYSEGAIPQRLPPHLAEEIVELLAQALVKGIRGLYPV